MLATVSRKGIVGDLIVFVAGSLQALMKELMHLEELFFRGKAYPALDYSLAQRGLGFRGQFIVREVLWGHLQDFRHLPFKVPHFLARPAEDEI